MRSFIKYFDVVDYTSCQYRQYFINFCFRLDEQLAKADETYDMPWYRVGPYFVGIIAGYILTVKMDMKLQLKKVNPPKPSKISFHLANVLDNINFVLDYIPFVESVDRICSVWTKEEPSIFSILCVYIKNTVGNRTGVVNHSLLYK